MKIALLSLVCALALLGTAAQATCTGSHSFSTCFDDNGNSYTVQRYGNITNMNGHNTRTGTTWSQQSQTMGNTTYHTGYASNGRSWNSTQMQMGSQTYYSGTNAQGEYFSYTCDRYGCN